MLYNCYVLHNKLQNYMNDRHINYSYVYDSDMWIMACWLALNFQGLLLNIITTFLLFLSIGIEF